MLRRYSFHVLIVKILILSWYSLEITISIRSIRARNSIYVWNPSNLGCTRWKSSVKKKIRKEIQMRMPFFDNKVVKVNSFNDIIEWLCRLSRILKKRIVTRIPSCRGWDVVRKKFHRMRRVIRFERWFWRCIEFKLFPTRKFTVCTVVVVKYH